jgi:hypothetical protein
MLNRDAIVLSQMASEEAVVRIARSVDGKDWLSDSAVRRIAIYIELTLDGRRLSGGDHYPEVLPDRHLASQRITRDGTVNVWTTVGAEQLLAFTDTTTAERFWSDWFYQTLRELGKRRGLRPLDEFWAPSSDRG